MSLVLVAQPLPLDADGGRRPRVLSGGVAGLAFEARVTSRSDGARRVSPGLQGRGVSHDGQVSRASSTGAPHAGHLRAEFTSGILFLSDVLCLSRSRTPFAILHGSSHLRTAASCA